MDWNSVLIYSSNLLDLKRLEKPYRRFIYWINIEYIKGNKVFKKQDIIYRNRNVNKSTRVEVYNRWKITF